MISRQAIWLTLASAAGLSTAMVAVAQPTPPTGKIPSGPTGVTPTVQILPVSLKVDQVAATVNGEKILVGDVKRLLDPQPYPVTLTEEQKKQMRQAALDVLIEEMLLRQYLAKNCKEVTKAEFDKEVEVLNSELKKLTKTLDMYLRENRQTQEQLSRDIVAHIQWRSLLARFCPDDKAKAYYDANKLFFDKVFVQASHIMIELDSKATKADRDKAEQTLRVLRQQILSGKMKFEDAVVQYSQCPTKKNKERPGDIGKFPYKLVVAPEISRAAFALKKGDLSDVVQSPRGLHLLLITDRTAGEPSTFESVKDAVRQVWAQEEELYSRILSDQQKNGQIKRDLP
jgi:parvulin-like peptidyl-prolyl isomerase